MLWNVSVILFPIGWLVNTLLFWTNHNKEERLVWVIVESLCKTVSYWLTSQYFAILNQCGRWTISRLWYLCLQCLVCIMDSHSLNCQNYGNLDQWEWHSCCNFIRTSSLLVERGRINHFGPIGKLVGFPVLSQPLPVQERVGLHQ